MQTKQPHHNSNSTLTHETHTKDTIQNFQFCSVRFRTYSSNISFIWSTLCRVTGTPVSGSWDCTTLRAKPHVSLAQPGITRAQTYCATLAQPTNTRVQTPRALYPQCQSRQNVPAKCSCFGCCPLSLLHFPPSQSLSSVFITTFHLHHHLPQLSSTPSLTAHAVSPEQHMPSLT